MPERIGHIRIDGDVVEAPSLGDDHLTRVVAVFVSEPLVPRTTRAARVFERRLGPQPQLRLSNVAATAARHQRHRRPRTEERRHAGGVRGVALASNRVPSAGTVQLREYNFFQSIAKTCRSTAQCGIADAFELRIHRR